MDLKEIKKQAYEMMLLNPNSSEYKQIKAYIEQAEAKQKDDTEELKKVVERLESVREDIKNNDSEEFVSFEGGDYSYDGY